ncbi:unnamed protein product [Macrosiphum euphorbiae]|uniref:Uncharacterized protein n=1 Tax=Macrosiphum euphorbiae TaxID=13131 RepID=A0AAV0VX90_9HEMI|nr:unnamed protein product [Macrosiphum euphorbiae]
MNSNKGRASCYAAGRLRKVYFSLPNIVLTTPETANRVPSATSSPADDGVENPDRTMECSDSGHRCAETAGVQDSDASIMHQVVTTNAVVKPIRADHF